MRLGSMHPKDYKFIQEKIFEGIFPFSRLRSPYNVLLLSFVYFLAGIGLYLFLPIPVFFFIAGTCAGIGISVWSYGILHYADELRDVQIERMNPVKRKFLVTFLEEMFHDRSIFFGVMAFVFSLAYFWSSELFGIENILQNLQRQSDVPILHPFLLVYIFIIAFDVCYRFGLSTYISLILLKRNLRAGYFLSTPRLKKHISPRDLLELERADWFHYISFSGAVFLFPLAFFDPILFICLFLYLFASVLATAINILHLRILQSKAIPKEVVNLLCFCRIAYIGTPSDQLIPHVTPTLFVFDGRRVFFVTSIKSQKVKNLHRHKNIAVCIDYRSVKYSKNRGVLIRGWARIYGHNIISAIFYVMVYGLRMLYVKILYHRKYSAYVRYYQFQAPTLPGPWRLKPILSRTIVEIIPYQYLYWKGAKFSRTAVI